MARAAGALAAVLCGWRTAMGALELRILDFLRNRDWTDAAELRKGVGAARKNEVNPTLYALERQGKIQKDTSSEQPRWRSRLWNWLFSKNVD